MKSKKSHNEHLGRCQQGSIKPTKNPLFSNCNGQVFLFVFGKNVNWSYYFTT